MLMPRTQYERDEEEAEFDPNLRTVYRKMTPEELDMFVYRMYAPHKHSAPRRDIYDEHRELVRRMNTFRDDDVPSDKPPMQFSKNAAASYDVDSDEDDRPLAPLVLSRAEKEEAHQRLYAAALRKEERQRLAQEEYHRNQRTVGTIKMNPEEQKTMQERLYQKRKPPPEPFVDLSKIKGGKPVPKPHMDALIERLLKTKPASLEPEQPAACAGFPGKKKPKYKYEEHEEFKKRIVNPIGRMKLLQETHPVLTSEERAEAKKAQGGAKWKGVAPGTAWKSYTWGWENGIVPPKK